MIAAKRRWIARPVTVLDAGAQFVEGKERRRIVLRAGAAVVQPVICGRGPGLGAGTAGEQVPAEPGTGQTDRHRLFIDGAARRTDQVCAVGATFVASRKVFSRFVQHLVAVRAERAMVELLETTRAGQRFAVMGSLPAIPASTG